MADISARRRIWGWFFFDWASQPYSTLLLTFIFSPYFAEVGKAHYLAQGMDAAAAGAAAQAYWGSALSLSGLFIALLAPILGAVADTSGRRLIWIWTFSVAYVVGSWGLWWLLPDGHALFWPVILFAIGLIGMEFATIFTNALLPDLGPHEEIGGISGSAFAFGYAGGVLSLILMLAFFAESGTSGHTLIGIAPLFGLDATMREGTRFVGPFTALWYVIFMVPFFLWVKEPKLHHAGVNIGAALVDLWRLLKSLGSRKSLSAYLASSMFYRDALNGLYGFGGIYASGVLDWSIIQIGIFGIVAAIAAAVLSWVGGRADRRFGPKPVIVVCILILIAVCTTVVFMTRQAIFGIPLSPGSALPDQVFYLCGALIGGAGGALQSASRTMMVRHTTPERATEAFGLYALSGKATSFIAPALIALMSTLTGSQRYGISPLIALFLLGLGLLVFVKSQGEKA